MTIEERLKKNEEKSEQLSEWVSCECCNTSISLPHMITANERQETETEKKKLSV